MGSNPQWNLPPASSQGPNHLAIDTSILDFKALSAGNHNPHNNDDQHNFHSFNNFFQSQMGNKDNSIFGKPPPQTSSNGLGYNNSSSFNNYSSGNSSTFSIGTFSTNDRPTQNSYSNDRSSQNSYTNDRSSQNSYSNDRSSQNMFSNDRSSQNSYSNDRSSQNSYGNERSSHNSYSNERSMMNSFGNDRPMHNSYSNERSMQNSNLYSSNGQNGGSSYSSANGGGDVFSSSTIPIPGMSGVGGPQGSYNQNNDSNSTNQGTRETGIIEKLLHSYGFIQCCERQARLFFHFSQFNGNIEHLKIGDPVEFEMTYDRRTGKPIASAVSKIAPEVVGVVLSEERVTGTVTTELRADAGAETITMGRISYENRGECFFLPYNKDDIEGNVSLHSGDKVSFQIAAKQRGNLGACHIRLENPAHPVRYQGVVCSMKESFGFIERADVVKEIFFHFSEAKLPNGDELHLGDDVEFNIQTRNGKEVACNITRLEPGSVVFEDVDTEIVKGQVLKPLERGHPNRQPEDALPGRIRYRAADHSEVEISFGEKDQRGEFTLRHGDWVQFRVATDRRDQLRRSTHISLLEESFNVSGERREQGIVVTTKDGFGFIKCADRDLSVFFHFNEVLDVDRVVEVNDEVEFTIVQDTLSSYSNNRQSAIRIKHLPSGSVQFETAIEQGVSGTVSKEAQHVGPRSPSKNSPQNSPQSEKQPEPGVITYIQGETKKTINYYNKDVESKSNLRSGDKVEFNVVQIKRTKEFLAVNVRGVKGKGPTQNGVAEFQGFIAALKESFGFIETIQHDREIFFHFSQLDGDPDKLELGMEVEYNLAPRGGQGSCMAAENVRILPKGTIVVPVCDAPLVEGVVVRPLRCVNPDQQEYAGLVQANEGSEEYEFGITGLVNKRELLQPGDPVQFQVAADNRATSIAAVRKKHKATVDAVKGQFGFLNYEVEEGKKLFFHMTEVKDGLTLQPGDAVEFTLVTNQRNGKSSACNVNKITDMGARPERLVNRLRTVSVEDGGPRLLVLRQPRGPDSSKGFAPDARLPRAAGFLLEAEA